MEFDLRRHGAQLAMAVGAAGLLAVAAMAAPGPHPAPAEPSDGPPATVLFLCPHGAAKSVLASAYFERLAKARGLNVRVVSAGTDPDPQVAPAVRGHLQRTGYDLPVRTPRRVTAEDLSTAAVVVSIGCDLRGLPPPTGTLLTWDDVPAPSEHFAHADARIRARVIELVDEMVRGQQP